MEKMQHVEKRDRDKAEVAKIDGTLEPPAHRLQNIKLLGSDKKGIALAARRPANRADERRAGLLHRNSMLRAVLGQQGEEKISMAEAGPGHVAGEFMALARFGGVFPANFVIDESDQAFERRVVIEHRVIAFLSE